MTKKFLRNNFLLISMFLACSFVMINNIFFVLKKGKHTMADFATVITKNEINITKLHGNQSQQTIGKLVTITKQKLKNGTNLAERQTNLDQMRELLKFQVI